MLVETPSRATLTELLGPSLGNVWEALCAAIEERYEMECLWSTGGKHWTYEYKYRRGDKTLCCLYATKDRLGFMVIFGKEERRRLEEIRPALSDSVCRVYDAAQTYRDGKWVMFQPVDRSEFEDYLRLLALKRKPNRN